MTQPFNMSDLARVLANILQNQEAIMDAIAEAQFANLNGRMSMQLSLRMGVTRELIKQLASDQ